MVACVDGGDRVLIDGLMPSGAGCGVLGVIPGGADREADDCISDTAKAVSYTVYPLEVMVKGGR